MSEKLKEIKEKLTAIEIDLSNLDFSPPEISMAQHYVGSAIEEINEHLNK